MLRSHSFQDLLGTAWLTLNSPFPTSPPPLLMATVPPSPFLRVLSHSLTVDPNEFNYLAVGESVVITYSYDVADGTTTTANTATITITGANDAPVVSAITSNKTEDDSSYSIDLLGTASDADNSDSPLLMATVPPSGFSLWAT